MTQINPMLCKPLKLEEFYKRDLVKEGYIATLKLDGMRAIVIKENGKTRIYSRTWHEYTNHVPHLIKEFDQYLDDGTILDGELVWFEDEIIIEDIFVPVVNFNRTMQIMGSGADVAISKQRLFGRIKFVAFDVLKSNYINFSAEQSSFVVRQAYLDILIHDWEMLSVSIVPTWKYFSSWNKTYFQDIFAELSKNNMEGLVLKHRDGLYQEGKRNNDQLKVKAEKSYDVFIIGGTEGQGKYAGQIGALEFGVYDFDVDYGTVGRGFVVKMGQCSGMTDADRMIFTADLETMVNKKQVITIKCNDLTSNGHPRHPRFVSLRTDKSATDCTLEQFKV